jgi:dienelactone hydrolase
MTVRLENVLYEADGVTFEGKFAFDDAATTPRPGVLIVHTALGLSQFEGEKAEALAAQGYTALAVDLYGKDVAIGSVDEGIAAARVLLSEPGRQALRMNLGLDVLRRHPATDAKRIAAIGYCLGGRAVLDLARAGADVAGVVSLHGGLIKGSAPTVTPIKPKILVLHGWNDPYVAVEHVTGFAAEMEEAGADWQLHAYGRTGHAFTNPHEPHVEENIGYQADSDRRSWKSLSDFLGELFPDQR